MPLQDNQSIIDSVMKFFTEFWGLIASGLLGVLAKVSKELLSNRKLSFIQWLGVVGVSVFFGYISGVICHLNGWVNQALWVVPTTTLFGEYIVLYVSHNRKEIGDRLLGLFISRAERTRTNEDERD